MKSLTLPIDELLAPVSDTDPCGIDMAYAPEFDALQTLALGKPERQTGDVVVPAEPPPWSEVYEAALSLARRTRDLRLGVLLARAGAHTQGFAGYADGLALIAGLLEQHWDHVHPQLDVEDGNDATMRLFALAPLCDPASGLAELRACKAMGRAHPLTMRMLELAWTKAELLPGESRPTQPGLIDGLRELASADAALLERMLMVHEKAVAIERTVDQHAGTAIAPDLKPLLRLTGAIAEAAGAAAGLVGSSTYASGGAGVDAAVAPGKMGSREDVVRTLGAVCEWIEAHEPTNPAPLLIRRAQRLMSKSFIDLVRDLAPDGLTQVERIAGVEAKT